jgi:hypothetical protein
MTQLLGGVAGRALRASAAEYPSPPPGPPIKRGVLSRFKLFSRTIVNMNGLGMTSAGSYTLAIAIVPLLAAQDYASAAGLLAGASPAEIAEVGRKAIALGADPDRAAQLVAFAGAEEVIEIVDSKPVIKPASRPWWHWGLGLLAAAGAGYGAYRKWGRR